MKGEQITKNAANRKAIQNSRWQGDEHARFLQGMQLYRNNWIKVSEFVGSRNAIQCRTHAQKHFAKVGKKLSDVSRANDIDIQCEMENQDSLANVLKREVQEGMQNNEVLRDSKKINQEDIWSSVQQKSKQEPYLSEQPGQSTGFQNFEVKWTDFKKEEDENCKIENNPHLITIKNEDGNQQVLEFDAHQLEEQNLEYFYISNDDFENSNQDEFFLGEVCNSSVLHDFEDQLLG